MSEATISDAAALHHGDALAILANLPTNSVDAVITDPPYSSGGAMRSDRNLPTLAKYITTGSGNQTRLADFTGDNRDQRAYAYWCALWLSECLRIVRPGGVLAQFTDWRQLPATTDAIQSGGWVWRGIVPWHKPGARPTPGRFTSACEYVVWGSAGGMPVDWTPGQPKHPGLLEASPPRKRTHPTEKPVAIMRQLVRIAPEGGVVLDPFMGAGTTGAACLTEGRAFIGIEQTETYYRLAVDRLQELPLAAAAASPNDAA